jgi:hypothetical protein
LEPPGKQSPLATLGRAEDKLPSGKSRSLRRRDDWEHRSSILAGMSRQYPLVRSEDPVVLGVRFADMALLLSGPSTPRSLQAVGPRCRWYSPSRHSTSRTGIGDDPSPANRRVRRHRGLRQPPASPPHPRRPHAHRRRATAPITTTRRIANVSRKPGNSKPPELNSVAIHSRGRWPAWSGRASRRC